jgi:hypothetical protein
MTEKESSSFLKKRTKKLFLIWPVLVKTPVAQINKAFARPRPDDGAQRSLNRAAQQASKSAS